MSGCDSVTFEDLALQSRCQLRPRLVQLQSSLRGNLACALQDRCSTDARWYSYKWAVQYSCIRLSKPSPRLCDGPWPAHRVVDLAGPPTRPRTYTGDNRISGHGINSLGPIFCPLPLTDHNCIRPDKPLSAAPAKAAQPRLPLRLCLSQRLGCPVWQCLLVYSGA